MTSVSATNERKSFRNGLQFGWDATSIELASTCLRKYQYSMIEGWQPVRKSVHLIFGGLYATALEHFYKHRALGLTQEEALREVIKEAMIKSWNLDFQGHSAKTRFSLIRAIVWYVEQFGENDNTETYIMADGKPAVELSFQIDIDEDLVLSGHLDRVVKFGDDLYWMDQKTTSTTISSHYFEQFNPHNQFSLYTYAGKAVLHSPIKGGIIDAAQIGAGFVRFERGFTHRSDQQLEEWFSSSRYIIDMARSSTTLGFFPMNLASCGNYGGCPFRAVCARPESVRKNFLKADFEQTRFWDPLEAR